MTTVMMITQPTTGGTARHVLELTAGCRDRGLAVHVVTDAGDRTFVDALRTRGAQVVALELEREISPVRDAIAALRVRDAITAVSPDVVHLHSAKAGALGRLATRRMRRRPEVIYTPHAYAFLAQPGATRQRCYRAIERGLAGFADQVVAVSSGEARVARALGGAQCVTVVRNGVATANGARRRRAGLRVGWLGRMTWQKDPTAAVTVSRVASQLGVPHELLLGGDGPQRGEVEAALADAPQARTLGAIADPAAFYDAIDLLLITSRAEGLPYAGLDAMARGLPIIAFHAPGVCELVAHGETGLLAPAGDAGALAAQLARLARDPQLRDAMGEAARLRARTEFSLDVQLDRICELYRALASRSHARRA